MSFRLKTSSRLSVTLILSRSRSIGSSPVLFGLQSQHGVVPPVEVVPNAGSHYKYKVRNGFRRFYGSVALGFPKLPVTTRFIVSAAKVDSQDQQIPDNAEIRAQVQRPVAGIEVRRRRQFRELHRVRGKRGNGQPGNPVIRLEAVWRHVTRAKHCGFHSAYRNMDVLKKVRGKDPSVIPWLL
jgi:hypothetical protein